MSASENRDMKRLKLHRSAVIFLFVYYLVILSAGLILSVYLIIGINDARLSLAAPLITITMSVVGAALSYSRKLYKACIEDIYSFSEEATWDVRTIGTMAFFALRPAFGIGFSLFTYFIWKAALLASVDKADLTRSHFYISGALGFISGFLIGRLLERLEQKGLNELDHLAGS